MLFDFKCPCGQKIEHWVKSDIRQVPCACGKEATRVTNGGMPVLEGISGDFPGAAIKWAKHHEQAARRQSD